MWDLSSPTRDQTQTPCLTCEASLMDQWWRIHLQCRGHWRFRLNPWSGRSPREGHGNPLQYSCLENPMDRGAWWTTVHRVTKRQTWLNTNTTILTYENRRFWRDAFFSIPTKKKKKKKNASYTHHSLKSFNGKLYFLLPKYVSSFQNALEKKLQYVIFTWRHV